MFITSISDPNHCLSMCSLCVIGIRSYDQKVITKGLSYNHKVVTEPLDLTYLSCIVEMLLSEMQLKFILTKKRVLDHTEYNI